MPMHETEEIQRLLEDAFAVFKQENPEVAEAIQVLNLSYEEYLRGLTGMRPNIYSLSGNTRS